MSNQHSPAVEADLESAVLEYMLQPLPGANRSHEYNLQRASRRIREEDDETVVRLVQRLRKAAPAPAMVVEVGAGTGGLSVAAARAGYDVVGIEPSRSGVRASEARARRYPGLGCRFVEGVAEKLPLADDSADACISNQVLEHVPGLERAAEEMYRVLKRGGLVLHVMPNYAFPYEPHYRIPWPPRASKRFGNLYLRMIGRDTEMFEDTIFPTLSGELVRLFSSKGFINVRNEYASEVNDKLRGVGIRSERAKSAIRFAKTVGILPILRRVVLRLELYPAIILMGRKP